ncbi:MAG: hypothetical protein AAF997_13320 [Myxococcota bacterium]
MPVVRTIGRVLLPCVVLLVGCPADPQLCPQAIITPDNVEIPDGENSTRIVVSIDNPVPGNGLEVTTLLSADSGSFDDPAASDTVYNCAFDVAGEVRICAEAAYVDPEADDAENTLLSTEGVGSSTQYIREPHVRLRDPLECSESSCTTVICPDEKNFCPEIAEFSAELTEVGGSTATLSVNAVDADDNPEPLVTMWTSDEGTVDDASSASTTFTCDPDVGGAIEVCVFVSDGDSACDNTRCTTVLCPGEPGENTCPVIASFDANPTIVPLGETETDIAIDVSDPDEFPSPLRTELRSETGVFDDRFVTDTTFRCGDSGPVELCLEVFDGDETCDQERCITVQCPSDIPPNICPQLFVLNAIPSVIPEGQITTMIQSRAQDTDFLPFPLVLTLRSFNGMISDDENIQEPNNVVAQNAMFTCSFPGPTEICVDATDGACEKTLCIEVQCPNDVPLP